MQPDLIEVRRYLVDRGWSIELEQTRAPGDAGRLARAAAEAGLDAALIAGGDGTLNEAVNALVGTQTAVGLLPCGTANVWARQLRMPLTHRALIAAARLMAEAQVRSIDVGRATVGLGTVHECSRYFLLWSGLGLDAHITHSVEPRPASFKRWGVIGYSLAALRAALAYRGARIEIEIDGRCSTERAMLAVVSNTELYAGYFHLTPQARLDDGWLDVSVFRGERFVTAIGYFLRALLHRYVHDSRVMTTRARYVRISTSTRFDVHVDAEPIGTSPAEFTVEPRALQALIPPCAPKSLFEGRI
ncbi:MAG TPA: diacylglycerol kinase family protein [Anaerolineae bacterium]